MSASTSRTTVDAGDGVGAITFRYTAAEADGSLSRGTVQADGSAQARGVLRDRGLFPIDIQRVGAAAERRAPISPRDLGIGLRALGNLLDAGLPVSRALAILHDIAPASWRDAT